ncbi:MAG: maleylpyruvate isomerase N-terminal domain-containing protein [Mycobacteriales bacterium]
MASGHQYYDADGAPLEVPGEPAKVAAAWRSHRTRLRQWFAGLPEDRWSSPTRCPEWRVTEMAAHLISATQFLGFTLHEAKRGNPTTLLRGFDPKAGPAALVAAASKRTPTELLAELTDVDARVDAEISGYSESDWQAFAESPAGHVPAYLSLTHMLFDSWVHERDLMVPAGEVPSTDADEASIVAAYVFGLSGIARAADEPPHPDTTLQLQLTDIDLTLVIQRAEGRVRVTAGAIYAPVDATGTAADLVSYTTGRDPEGRPVVDASAATYLSNLVTRMN